MNGKGGTHLDRDVVAKEHAGSRERDGRGDARDELLFVDLVENLGGGKTLRLDALDGEDLLFGRQPVG